MIVFVHKTLFHLKWLVMSDRDKYVYLWGRTRNNLK